jgi:hypothetical protein
MKDVFSRVFTLEVEGRPTLSFEARRTREAQEICKESWLRGDLIVLNSGGVPSAAIDRSSQCGWQPTKRPSFMKKPPTSQSRPMI